MKKTLHLNLIPEFHACLKEIARQQGTTMTDIIYAWILGQDMKDENGKPTDGENWILEQKAKKKRGSYSGGKIL